MTLKNLPILGHSEQQMQRVNICPKLLLLLLSLTSATYLLQVLRVIVASDNTQRHTHTHTHGGTPPDKGPITSLQLIICLASIFSDPDLPSLLTFEVPNRTSFLIN
jgi:hypothetical protein